MIVHLLSDPDFNNSIIHQFEVANPKKNIYVFSTAEQLEKTLLNYSEINTHLFDPDDIKFNFEGVFGIIIHCMSLHSAKFLLHAPGNIPVLWSIFGIDLYNFIPTLQSKIYGSKTKNYLYGKSYLSKSIFRIKFRYSFIFKSSNQIQRKAIKRASMYSTVVPTEKEIAKQFLPKNCRYAKLTVGHLHFINKESLDIIDEKRSRQLQVYIGNSGNESNNHLELIDELAKLDNSRFQINLQLSYGGKPDYVKHIEKEFRSNLKNKINVITSWMGKDEYYTLINDQNVFLFNSIRQQGVGAIIMAIWCGAKVFLNDQNPVFKYFAAIGITIFSIQKDLDHLKNEFEPLTSGQIITNRQLLFKDFSFESVNVNTINAVTALNNHFHQKY